jgi:hypothetical protein
MDFLNTIIHVKKEVQIQIYGEGNILSTDVFLTSEITGSDCQRCNKILKIKKFVKEIHRNVM